MDIGGSPGKEGVSVAAEEMSGGRSFGGGVHWGTVASGDKYFVRFQGKSTYDKDGKLQTAEGMWKYAGGTGKLKGLEGKGTYKGSGSPDGSATYEVEGEYSLPK